MALKCPLRVPIAVICGLCLHPSAVSSLYLSCIRGQQIKHSTFSHLFNDYTSLIQNMRLGASLICKAHVCGPVYVLQSDFPSKIIYSLHWLSYEFNRQPTIF